MKKNKKTREVSNKLANIKEPGIFNRFSGADKISKISYFVMGYGAFMRGQIVKGLLYLVAQIAYIAYFVGVGFSQLLGLISLGVVEQGKVFDESLGIYIYSPGDNSMLFLLFGVLGILMFIGFVLLWYSSIKGSLANEALLKEGKKLPTFKDELKTLLNERFHYTILSVPTMMTFALIILPLIFMILLAFTNFDKNHQPPGTLFTWVGLRNFKSLLYANPILSTTFIGILKWTAIWAVFATFLNYIFGMMLAMIINRKGIKFKGFWRTMFVISIAVPQFVTLLVMAQLLHDRGAINIILKDIGWISESIRFLLNGTNAKIVVIIVNMWIGIPYTMLITSGILMNIPKDLYESAKIDGAGPVVQFFKITLPYMLSVTGPYLITQFIGNINNFNVIFLLTGGGPLSLNYFQAGETDLLITWLYKLTLNEKNYALASTIGIVIFAISATLSLIVFRRVTGDGKEGQFQ